MDIVADLVPANLLGVARSSTVSHIIATDTFACRSSLVSSRNYTNSLRGSRERDIQNVTCLEELFVHHGFFPMFLSIPEAVMNINNKNMSGALESSELYVQGMNMYAGFKQVRLVLLQCGVYYYTMYEFLDASIPKVVNQVPERP